MNLDTMSFKLNGISVFLSVITGNEILMILAGMATGTTFIYNGIKIYKELKNKKNAQK